MKPAIENPAAWLWGELETLLPVDQLEPLRQRYQAHSRLYNRASLLRHTRRELALYERNVTLCTPERRQSYREKIARRKARIAELEAEIGDNIIALHGNGK